MYWLVPSNDRLARSENRTGAVDVDGSGPFPATPLCPLADEPTTESPTPVSSSRNRTRWRPG